MLDEIEEIACGLLAQVEDDIEAEHGDVHGVTCYLWYRPSYEFAWTIGLEHNDMPVCLMSGRTANDALASWNRNGILEVRRIVTVEAFIQLRRSA